jgi:hypothetical protein
MGATTHSADRHRLVGARDTLTSDEIGAMTLPMPEHRFPPPSPNGGFRETG